MKISDKLSSMYSDYYDDESVKRKRNIAAKQSIAHVKSTLNKSGGKTPANLIDIGAGEGALLAEMELQSLAKSLHAVEISQSGLSAIKSRNLATLATAELFDGYKINADNKQFDFGTAVHVLEHVEHERLFLHEVCRVCKRVYVEVPLELTARLGRSISASRPFGHINFYNFTSFRNLLETSDLKVISIEIFTNSLEYECFLSGRLKGTIKYLIKKYTLRFFPTLANMMFTYLAGAIIEAETD